MCPLPVKSLVKICTELFHWLKNRTKFKAKKSFWFSFFKKNKTIKVLVNYRLQNIKMIKMILPTFFPDRSWHKSSRKI